MINPIRVTIHQAGNGVCSLSGKESDGVTVTFDDGTVTEQHLSWKSFRQLVAMKTAQTVTRQTQKSGADTSAPALPSDGFSKPVAK